MNSKIIAKIAFISGIGLLILCFLILPLLASFGCGMGSTSSGNCQINPFEPIVLFFLPELFPYYQLFIIAIILLIYFGKKFSRTDLNTNTFDGSDIKNSNTDIDENDSDGLSETGARFVLLGALILCAYFLAPITLSSFFSGLSYLEPVVMLLLLFTLEFFPLPQLIFLSGVLSIYYGFKHK